MVRHLCATQGVEMVEIFLLIVTIFAIEIIKIKEEREKNDQKCIDNTIIVEML